MSRLPRERRVFCTALVALVPTTLVSATACQVDTDAPARVGSVSGALSCEGDVLGFESLDHWSIDSGLLELSDNAVQGASSLAITPENQGYMLLTSVATTTPATVANQLNVDVYVPQEQLNPFWMGDVQIFVEAPSAGLFNAWLDIEFLTGRDLGAYNTLTFDVPGWVQNALASANDDVVYKVALNVPPGSPGTYLIDSLRHGIDEPDPCDLGPVCGNSIVEPGEVCDEGATETPTECPEGEALCTVCTANCLLITLPSDTAVTLVDPLTSPQFSVEDTVIGYTFSVSDPIVVTELGFYDLEADGLAEAHDVGIYSNDGELVVAGVVPAGTAAPFFDGDFHFVPVSPTTLPPGDYSILAYLPSDADLFRFNAPDVIPSPFVDLNLDVDHALLTQETGGLVFSDDLLDTDNGLYGPNFRLAGAAPAVP